jgi:hypothetical protein
MGEMKLGVVAVLLLVVGGVSGCGGNGSSSSASSNAPDPFANYPEGPTRQFIIPGGNNRVQVYGREASALERKEVSARIHKWMRARAARDFATDCKYLSQRLIKGIVSDAETGSNGKVKTCPATLAYLGSTASGDYKNTLGNLPIVSFRVRGGFGYAQYHGRDGNDWIVPMNREHGKWLVNLPAPASRSEQEAP